CWCAPISTSRGAEPPATMAAGRTPSWRACSGGPIDGSCARISPAGTCPAGGNIMTTRRDFLKSAAAAATGIVFCGCGLIPATHPQSASTARQPVTVNGRRVKTIDVHSHCHFHEATSLLGEAASTIGGPLVRGGPEAYIEIETRIRNMDAQRIDMEVLSINPF